MHNIKAIAADFKQVLQEVYGDQLTDLILFGSYARGDFRDDSDVDFAIVLKNPEARTTAEILRLAPVSAELSMKYGVIVSILPVAEKKLNTSMQGVYQSIRQEGVRM